jgi:hypothetical protein
MKGSDTGSGIRWSALKSKEWAVRTVAKTSMAESMNDFTSLHFQLNSLLFRSAHSAVLARLKPLTPGQSS